MKEPRRAEVNYCPDYPTGQTKASLEEERLALLAEVQKNNNQQVVKEKMERTFAYRRHEVIEDKPFIADFKRRWPALFSERENDATETRRACVLKALIVYLNEDPETLIREYTDVEDNQETMEQTILGVFTIKKEGAEPTDDLEDVGIIMEGVEVLHDLGNIANAAAILFGLMYSLDLSYPTKLRYTFEVLQKVVLELDGNQLSTKAQVLKTKLFEGTI